MRFASGLAVLLALTTPSITRAQDTNDRPSWSEERARAATSDELARWALGSVPTEQLDHRFVGGGVYTDGIVFRLRPKAIGDVCKSESIFTRTHQPEPFLGMSAAQQEATGFISLVGAPYAPRISYRARSAGCVPWETDTDGFAAESDGDAVKAISTLKTILSAVGNGSATVECHASVDDCRQFLAAMTLDDLRRASQCTDDQCRSLEVQQGPEHWRRLRIWISGTEPLSVEVTRGPPPLQP